MVKTKNQEEAYKASRKKKTMKLKPYMKDIEEKEVLDNKENKEDE